MIGLNLAILLVSVASIYAYEPFYNDASHPENAYYYPYNTYKWKRSFDNLSQKNFENTTNCHYRPLDSVLSCRNMKLQEKLNLVECKAKLNLKGLEQLKFDMFGISPNTENTLPIKYHLYPFKLNATTNERIFYNYDIVINEDHYVLSLYSTGGASEYGIRVDDQICFKRLSDLFEASSRSGRAELNISPALNLSKIVFIGDLFVENTSRLANVRKGAF